MVMEKPFGTDLKSARELNDTVHEVFSEDQIFRIDHFLGKEAALNMLALRFANGFLEPLWNREHIDHVQIDVPETLVDRHARRVLRGDRRLPGHGRHAPAAGARSRGDGAAAVARAARARRREAQGLPLDAADRARRTWCEVSTRDIETSPVSRPTRRWRRSSPRASSVDNWRWAGVPFFLRTGKCMAEGARVVSIAFREPPKSMFPAGAGVGGAGPDHLTFDLADTPRLSLSFYGKRPGARNAPREGEHAVLPRRDPQHKDVLEAYERLLHDAMTGDRTLFTTAEGVERLWEISAAAARAAVATAPYAQGRGARPRSMT